MIKPQAMKVKCIKCLATTIIAPKSDAVIVRDGEVVGAVNLIENVIKSLFRQK